MNNTQTNSRLWYRQPAKDWNEALPVGNGRLGGMIHGNAMNENIQLNEDSVWYGGPTDRNNPEAPRYLEEIRKLIFDGQIRKAEKLAALALSGTPESQRPYQTLGNLHIHFEHESEIIENYERDLNLETAMASVSYTAGGRAFRREYFSSAADQVMVVRITSEDRGAVSLSAYLRRGRYLDGVRPVNENTILMYGNCGEGGVRFATALFAVAEGGLVKTIGETLLVEGADTVTLILSAATTYRNPDCQERCLQDIDGAAAKSWEQLMKNHLEDYQNLYKRVELALGTEAQTHSAAALATDERLRRLKDGGEDPGLLAMYFQYGRYLLISCSRPGTLPANLQGLWNNDMLPPWDSKYTININTQMNYWPAEVCNLAECHLPLFDHLERMRGPGRVTAQKMYGCKGFTAHHNTDIWGDTAPQDIWIPATYWPMGAAWLSLHLWEHYEFGRDLEFLKKAYPVLKEAAEFFTGFLIENEKGQLVTCPSVSPENTYLLPNGESGCLCSAPSMDSQIIRLLFTGCIKASGILGIDGEFSDELEKMLLKIPKPEIGKFGQIKEWAEDYEEAEPGHRHISHLFALHPGSLIDRERTPELAAAARTTLERRLAHGGGHTGWSRAWIINMWARLEDSERACENVMELLRKSTLPNLFDNHPPFQIDGNFGGTAGMAEMFLQSHTGEIKLLPALPAGWTEGCVRGLRARGGLELDLEWREGILCKAVVRVHVSGSFVFNYRGKKVMLDLASGTVLVLDGDLQESVISTSASHY